MARRRMRSVVGLAVLGLTFFTLGWLCGQGEPPAQAQAPSAAPAPAAAPAAPIAPAAAPSSSDYASRVVAYIYGNVPVTREELGEYLIARYGIQKLPLLVNKRIIEMACEKQGIEVSAAEVEADIDQTIGTLNVKRKEFLEQVLKQRRLTLYEWKEDVVRPKLLLSKLCRNRIKIEEQDLKEAFEAHYGEKIDAQVIIYPKGEERILAQVYEKIRKNADDFDNEARKQADPYLARTCGHIAPINRHLGKEMESFEKAAFRLQPGEVSEEIKIPQGVVVIKCLKRNAPDKDHTLEKERAALVKEITEMKLQRLVQVVFTELHNEAKPNLLLKDKISEKDLKAFVEHEMKEARKESSKPPAIAPHRN